MLSALDCGAVLAPPRPWRRRRQQPASLPERPRRRPAPLDRQRRPACRAAALAAEPVSSGARAGATGAAAPLTAGTRSRGLAFSPGGLCRCLGGSLLRFLGPDLALDLSPLHDILIVLFERGREDMAAAAVGDEIEVFRLGRLQHRLDRRASRTGDRRRRQAIDLISVILACRGRARPAGWDDRARPCRPPARR